MEIETDLRYDLHQHLWPEAFVAALRERGVPPRLEGDALVTREGRFAVDLAQHDPERRLRTLDRDEIDVAVLSLQPTLGLGWLSPEESERLEETWIEGVQELAGTSDGRFLAFSPARLRPGVVGVSIGASALLGLDASASLLDEVERSGRLLFVHPDPAERDGAHPDQDGARRPPWWDWVVGYPAQMQAAYFAWLADGRRRWPRLRLLFAILAGGAPLQLERLARRGIDVRSALDPNVHFDVATYGRRAIELCVETFGVTQLAYGSDVPVVESAETLDAVRGFGDSVARILHTETPTRLLR
jgi:hypothetical protein